MHVWSCAVVYALRDCLLQALQLAPFVMLGLPDLTCQSVGEPFAWVESHRPEGGLKFSRQVARALLFVL